MGFHALLVPCGSMLIGLLTLLGSVKYVALSAPYMMGFVLLMWSWSGFGREVNSCVLLINGH